MECLKIQNTDRVVRQILLNSKRNTKEETGYLINNQTTN